ncbi:MAG: valine--tRNA ligase [Bdellovibrionales bacterium]|nr:valine--tRNA ligase [Bdellovibrionales bacterium]
MATLPKKYNHQEVEEKCLKSWKEQGVYSWDSTRPREETFSVDTPPPTVSGSLHVGHVFSYTHTDVVVRYQRMTGKNIFYPMGWDDNGLPTERRVQNYYGIKCNPKVPYNPNWKPVHDPKGKKEVEEVSRKNFIEACNVLTKEDEEAFRDLWSRLGLSVDWNLEYATIDDHCRKISQLSFLDLFDKGELISTESPTMWDIDFQSAIAQAELEDREQDGLYHDIRFQVADSDQEFQISTTRPELLAACIAVVAHPDDERYKPLFGKEAITPLFHARVPIRAAEHADPEKGTGILMVCTFGDIHDVEWWKQSKLPLKQILGRDGKLLPVTFGEGAFQSDSAEKATEHYSHIAGLFGKQARKKIAELLAEPGSTVSGDGSALVGEPRPTRAPVKFYEKGDRPLEFVPTRQWYVKVLDQKEQLLHFGSQVKWHPEYMYTRYQHWVEGLNQEWCISRQRYFGVPIPVWYPVRTDGTLDYDSPILPKEDQLPIDPTSDTPQGFKEEQRDQPGGFSGDPDVMDTWATSALTPQIMSYWRIDDARHKLLFPMDLRPQGHDIIRTWAFTTIAKAMLHEGSIPWKHICLSGWILDPDRKKMSKSKGNVVTPGHLLDEYSSDGVRYWAARARLGTDTAFDDKVFGIGRKLVTKIFNASKFVLSQFERLEASPTDYLEGEVSEALDQAFLARLSAVVEASTTSYSRFDYAHALQVTEELFWDFCDHYLELVKSRSYAEEDSAERRSALITLSVSLKTFLQLFAPVLPFVTEEVWGASYGRGDDSIHKSRWPESTTVAKLAPKGDPKLFELGKLVIGEVRAVKTAAQKSLKWPVSELQITGTEETLLRVRAIEGDLARASNASSSAFRYTDSPIDSVAVVATLADSNPG